MAAGYFGSTAAVYSSAAGTLSILTPQNARSGDVLILAMAAPSSASPTAPSGWGLLAALPASDPAATAYFYRRTVAAVEPALHVFTVGVGLSPWPIGLAMLYRGTDATAAIVASAVTSYATGTAQPAPSVTLGVYSDTLLAVYYLKDAAATATLTATGQRGVTVHGSAAAGGGSLVVVQRSPEVVGASGATAGTWSAAAAGLAATIVIRLIATIAASSVVPDVPGAIGLTTIGA